MLNFNSILVGSENPQKLADFYQKVVNQKPGWEGGGFVGWQVGQGWFMVGPHDKVKGKSPNPERVLIGFETADVQGEFERIKGLGAEVVAKPYHPGEAEEMTLATFADPDGNYFQLASPMTEA
jgi:predicted enzyme related to lactoylglutathione lyase